MQDATLLRAAEQLDERYWAGSGGTDSFPLTVGTEANLMDGSGDENAFVHEFAHSLMNIALSRLDPDFTSELDRAYESAWSGGLWADTYAITNVQECWAEGVQSWFDVNRNSCVGGDGVHNDINTRAELEAYDVPLFTLLNRVYKEGLTLPK